MFWSEDRLRFYHDAALKSDFHQKISDFIAPHISPNDTVLDLGCGLGFLIDELKSKVKNIWGADIDQRALKFLNERQPEVSTYRVKFPEELPPPADVLITMFFGRNLIEHEAFDKLYHKKHIVIRNRSRCKLEVPDQRALDRRTDLDMVEYAKSHGLMYDHYELDLRFDQPLRSREDALIFAMNYKPTEDKTHYDDYLERVLEPTDDPEFPFVIRKSKELGIVIIRKEEL